MIDMNDKEQTQLDTLDDAERERLIDLQDYHKAMERYKANPVSYSLDEVAKELKSGT